MPPPANIFVFFERHLYGKDGQTEFTLDKHASDEEKARLQQYLDKRKDIELAQKKQ